MRKINTTPLFTFGEILFVLYFAVTISPFVLTCTGLMFGGLIIVNAQQLSYVLISTFLAITGLFIYLLPRYRPRENTAAIATARLTRRR